MTALQEYDRIEAAGLWRPNPDAQRTDVIASIGDATIVISDMRERPLAHWSLPAIRRANPGDLPAIYYPDGDPGETLELAETERHVIENIERLRLAIERKSPRPGRLRLLLLFGVIALLVLGSVLWLPAALRQHVSAVVPEVKRAEIGEALLAQIERISGAPCDENGGRYALLQLEQRLLGKTGNLFVMRDGVQSALHLPGGKILLSRTLVEDYQEPDVVAGYIVVENVRAMQQDALIELLTFAGVWETSRLLTTGDISPEVLQAYGKHIVKTPPVAIEDDVLLRAFEVHSVRAAPYAYAIDVTGETTLGLIEADPFKATPGTPLLSDAEWVRLQGICGG